MNLRFEFSQRGTIGVRLAVLNDDDVLWPGPNLDGDGAADFDAEDILSYLADAWASLLLTEVWPAMFEPDEEPRSITGLQRAADERWERETELGSGVVAAEAAALEVFLYRHNLRSVRMAGMLPNFFMLRQGSRYRVEVNGQVYTSCAYRDLVGQLERLGEFARNCLAAAGTTYAAIIARWDARDDVEPATAMAYVTALPVETLQGSPDFIAHLSVLHGRTLRDYANDNAEPLVAVARSSGALGPAGIVAALNALRGLARGSTVELASRRRVVRAGLRATPNPTDQGIRASTEMRDWMRSAPDRAFDLEKACRLLGVSVVRTPLDERIDGLASAGPEHGPAILLNPLTMRRGGTDADLDRALRFTWAHELGHLLLDDSDWPALIDSVQQRVPRWIETRANAFAAYLLLPTSTAYQAFDEQRPRLDWDAAEPVLNRICARFEVTRIVASRQILRGAPAERRRALEEMFQRHMPRVLF